MLYSHIILTAFIGIACARPLFPNVDVDLTKSIQDVGASVTAGVVANAVGDAAADCEEQRVAAQKAIEKAQNLQIATVKRMRSNGVNRLAHNPKDYDIAALELPNLLVNPKHDDDDQTDNAPDGHRTLLEARVDLWSANRAVRRIQQDAKKAQEDLQQCLASLNDQVLPLLV